MRLAVVDNDASEAERLTDGIRKSAEDIEIYRYKSGDEFIGVWEKDKFDIVILDILSGDKNGMDIARAVRQATRTCVSCLHRTAVNSPAKAMRWTQAIIFASPTARSR